MEPQASPRIAHLTSEQLDALIARYYAGEKNSALAEEFGIAGKPADLHKLFPPKVLATRCPYCDVAMWQKQPSKSAYSSSLPYCPSCSHEDSARSHAKCRCRNCLAAAAAERQRIADAQRQAIDTKYAPLEQWKEPDVPNLVRQFTLADAAYLMALYRSGNVDGAGTIGPPYATERPFAPTFTLARQAFNRLLSRQLIRISPTSPLEAFVFNDDNTEVTGFYDFKVRYRVAPMLPAELAGAVIAQIERFARHRQWLDDLDEALQLWKELALHECLEFFAHQGRQHQLEPPAGEKTVLMFRSLLEDYSVAQVYNFVWGAARDAAAYYQRARVSKPQAANSMVGNCRSRAEKAKVEKWHVKGYGRNYDLPRSELSRVVHDVLLGIGEDGFTEKPSMERLIAAAAEEEPQAG